MHRPTLIWFAGLVLSLLTAHSVEAQSLRVASFQLDVTPPIGSPLCEGFVPEAVKIDDPLFVRGIVILGAAEPIVLCAVDFVGLGNSGYDAWREALARAAGTTATRVAVHALHQHDAPGCDLSEVELLMPFGIEGKACDVPFIKDVLKRLELVVKKSIPAARSFTQIGVGQSRVDRVASSRRILGEDGKVKIVRYSSSTDPAAIAAPEGLIDPELKLLSFWDGDTPLISITYYATHPQSHYGKGAVSADFVGLARAMRDQKEPKLVHLHFNGAGGNLAAGKYNNGTDQARRELTERLAAGMEQAWKKTKRTPITVADIEWRVEPVSLPIRDRLRDLGELEKVLQNENRRPLERICAAKDIAFARRMAAGLTIDLTSLRLGQAVILGLPGEIFVEYQLAAQKMRRDRFVCTAGYGDEGPGYIGTAIAYGEGGYETGVVSRTAPEVEEVLLKAIGRLLK